MNDDPIETYDTDQDRLDAVASDIRWVVRKHMEHPANISWDEAVELLRQLASQLEYDHTEWPAPPDYSPDYDPHE